MYRHHRQRPPAEAVPAFGIRNVSHETPELYRTSGRLQLGLFATLAEYERELINERVRAGVMAAKARGVKFGQQPVDETTVEDKVETARQLLAEGKTATRVAKTVGWSRATLYRYLKMYGHEAPAKDEAQLPVGPGKSRYSTKKTVPVKR